MKQHQKGQRIILRWEDSTARWRRWNTLKLRRREMHLHLCFDDFSTILFRFGHCRSIVYSLDSNTKLTDWRRIKRVTINHSHENYRAMLSVKHYESVPVLQHRDDRRCDNCVHLSIEHRYETFPEDNARCNLQRLDAKIRSNVIVSEAKKSEQALTLSLKWTSMNFPNRLELLFRVVFAEWRRISSSKKTTRRIDHLPLPNASSNGLAKQEWEEFDRSKKNFVNVITFIDSIFDLSIGCTIGFCQIL